MEHRAEQRIVDERIEGNVEEEMLSVATDMLLHRATASSLTQKSMNEQLINFLLIQNQFASPPP